MEIKENKQVKRCLAVDLLNKKNREYLHDLDMALLTSTFMIGGVETVGLPFP